MALARRLAAGQCVAIIMKYSVVLIVLAPLLIASQLYGAAPPAATQPATSQPWSHLNFLDDPRNFQFAVVSDNTGGSRPGVFDDAVAKLNLMGPRFVMSVGDLIQGYTNRPDEINRMWDGFQAKVAKLQMPFFYVVGNHDYSNPVMAREWARRFGKAYYSFVYQDVLFLCLNSDDPHSRLGSIGAEQLKWLEQTLAEHAKVRWTMVFLHRPMWIERPNRDQPATGDSWKAVEKLLRAGDRKYTVFAGHLHNYRKDEHEGRAYYNLATTGGGMATLPPDVGTNALGVLLGRFDHFTWVTMTDQGPQIANVLLDGVWGGDVRTGSSVDFGNSLLRRSPVWLEPVMTRELKFTRAATQLRVVNDSDVTLRMRGTFDRSAQLTVEPENVYLEVPAKSERAVDVTISSELPAQVKVLLPIKLHWQLEYAMEQGGKFSRPFRVHSVSRYAVTPLQSLPKRDTAATIDGKLNEWEPLAIAMETPAQVLGAPAAYHGEKDASCRFAVQYDDRFLYVAAKVTDDQLVLDRARVKPASELDDFKGVEAQDVPQRDGTEFTRQLDGLEIRVDARTDPERSLSRGTNPLTTSAFIAVHPPQGGKTRRALFRPGRLPEGTRVESGRIDGGYTVEAAIPIQYIIDRQGLDWSRLRINVTINDVDGSDESPVRLPWQPAWSDEMNVVASGTFERAR